MFIGSLAVILLVLAAVTTAAAASSRRSARRASTAGSTRKKSSRRSGLKALVRMEKAVMTAFFRRRRRAAFSGDADARREEVARLAVRASGQILGTRIKSLFVGKARRQRMRAQASLKAAQDAAATMGEMKGLAMKLAQYASFVMPVSDEPERELATLQSGAPPMDAELIVGQLKAELGQDVMDRFTDFGMEPIASASIGQVHRATLADGRDVVLKVQYPGVEKAVLADLETLDDYLSIYGLMGMDIGSVMQTFERTLRNELDYRLEAENQSAFAAHYRGHPFVKIPEVIPELSTSRVLTTEFVPGVKLYDVLDSPQEERNRLGEIIYRFAFESIMRGLFTADPHPGNYLFLDDGRVCFIDFGFVERFDDPERDIALYKAPLIADLMGDIDGLAEGLRALGLVPPKGSFNPEKMWAAVHPWFWGPVGEDRDVRVSVDAVAAQAKAAVKPGNEMMKALKSPDLAPWLMMLTRYVPGTVAILGRLQSEANWRQISRELAMGGKPATELGKHWTGHAAVATTRSRP